MSNIVYGNSNRLFVNTALGCTANCAYCYLKFLNLSEDVEYYTPEMVLKMVFDNDNFKPGRHGTIISLGCYSESWSEKNKTSTIEIIKQISKLGNYIQMSTKKQILYKEAVILNEFLTFQKQLQVNISVPTISASRQIEPGTDEPFERLRILEHKRLLPNIEFMLYIKPVLPHITILDLEHYVKIVNNHQVRVIIGDALSYEGGLAQLAEVGEGKLFEHQVDESNFLREEIGKYTNVYCHSTEALR